MPSDECVQHHRVAIHDRGGARRLYVLTDLASVTWSRGLNTSGQAEVLITGRYCRAQADTLKTVARMMRRGELVIYRGDERVFEGPLIDAEITDDYARLVAADVTQYAAHRDLTRDWPTIFGGDAGSLMMMERVARVLEYELTTDYLMEVGHREEHRLLTVPAWESLDPPANVWPHVDVRPSATLGTLADTLAFEMTVLEHIQNLADAGLNWTTVGRRWVLWDAAYAIGKTRRVSEADFRGQIKVYYSGQDLATIAHVSGRRPDGPSQSPVEGVTIGVGHSAISDAEVTPATNRLTNPSFEEGVAGWTQNPTGAGFTIVQSGAWAADGAFSMAVTAPPDFSPGGAAGYVSAISPTIAGPFEAGDTVVLDAAVLAREGQSVRAAAQIKPGTDAINLIRDPRAGFVTGGGYVFTNLTAAKDTTFPGTRPDGTGQNGWYMSQPTGADSYIAVDTAQMGLQAGKTYILTGTGSVRTLMSGTEQANRARRLVVFWSSGGAYTEAPSPPIPNVVETGPLDPAKEHRVSVEFTLPAGTTSVLIRMYLGHTVGAITWTNLRLTEKTTGGIDDTVFFTGADKDTPVYDYSWQTGSEGVVGPSIRTALARTITSDLFATFPGQPTRVAAFFPIPEDVASLKIALQYSARNAAEGATEQVVFWDDVWVYPLGTAPFDVFYGPWASLQTQAQEGDTSSGSAGDAQSQAALNSQADRLLVGTYPLPLEIRAGDGSLILSDTLTAASLVPGVVMPVTAQFNLTPVAQDQMLTTVQVTEDGGGENVKVTLVPAGEVVVI